MNYGSEELKKAVIPDVLAGKKFIALAISEAFAGSDVAGLRCTAKKTPVCSFFKDSTSLESLLTCSRVHRTASTTSSTEPRRYVSVELRTC